MNINNFYKIMKKVLVTILFGLLLNSCGYYCYVSSIGNSPQNQLYYILPNNPNLVGDLEFEQYAKSLDNMGDYQNIINTAVEEAEIRGHMRGLEQGREEGREEGREQGRQEANTDAARKFKLLGVDVDIIAQATGLAIEEIKEL